MQQGLLPPGLLPQAWRPPPGCRLRLRPSPELRPATRLLLHASSMLCFGRGTTAAQAAPPALHSPPCEPARRRRPNHLVAFVAVPEEPGHIFWPAAAVW